MRSKTEQKIIKTALKIFSEKGYAKANTKDISERSGFSEMTLFRNFKTKQNLFYHVIEQNIEKFYEEFSLILVEMDFGTPEESFRYLIEHLLVLIEDNYDFINVFFNERNMIEEDVLKKIGEDLSDVIEYLYPDCSVNYRIYALNIISFILGTVLDIKFGSTDLDNKESIEEFISNSLLLFEN